MVKKLGYPSEMLSLFKYDNTFAIKGLFFDRNRATLLKLDSLARIWEGSVFFGRKPLSLEKLNEWFPPTF